MRCSDIRPCVGAGWSGPSSIHATKYAPSSRTVSRPPTARDAVELVPQTGGLVKFRHFGLSWATRRALVQNKEKPPWIGAGLGGMQPPPAAAMAWGPGPINSARPLQDLLGRTLAGRFRIDQVIGDGGMAKVFLAYHLHLRRSIALKVLKPRFCADPASIERFKREAQASAAISSPHIVSVLDVGSVGGNTVYIAMEYLRGRDLEQLLMEEPKLRWTRARPWFMQITQGLGAVHRHGIVHRDIKPSNIMVTQPAAHTGSPDTHGSELIKILDFGIAKLALSTSQAALTETGAIFGTAKYMSPEQAQGSATVDHRSDIYSVGVMLFEALCGRVPFDGDSFMQIANKHLQEPVPSIQGYRPDLPQLQAIDALVTRALQKHPEQRFSSMQEFEHAIEAIDPMAKPKQPTIPERMANKAPEGTLVLEDGGLPPELLARLAKRKAQLQAQSQAQPAAGGGPASGQSSSHQDPAAQRGGPKAPALNFDSPGSPASSLPPTVDPSASQEPVNPFDSAPVHPTPAGPAPGSYAQAGPQTPEGTAVLPPMISGAADAQTPAPTSDAQTPAPAAAPSRAGVSGFPKPETPPTAYPNQPAPQGAPPATDWPAPAAAPPSASPPGSHSSSAHPQFPHLPHLPEPTGQPGLSAQSPQVAQALANAAKRSASGNAAKIAPSGTLVLPPPDEAQPSATPSGHPTGYSAQTPASPAALGAAQATPAAPKASVAPEGTLLMKGHGGETLIQGMVAPPAHSPPKTHPSPDPSGGGLRPSLGSNSPNAEPGLESNFQAPMMQQASGVQDEAAALLSATGADASDASRYWEQDDARQGGGISSFLRIGGLALCALAIPAVLALWFFVDTSELFEGSAPTLSSKNEASPAQDKQDKAAQLQVKEPEKIKQAGLVPAGSEERAPDQANPADPGRAAAPPAPAERATASAKGDKAGASAQSDSKATDKKQALARSPEAILGALRPVRKRVKRCGDKGVVKVAMRIAPNGRVISARALDEYKKTPIGRCVVAAVKKAKFPAVAARKPMLTHQAFDLRP